MQVVWRFEIDGRTSVNRESRVWFGGRAQGMTEFMRMTALVCALLHKRLVVGYNEYNKRQLTPMQVLALYGPEAQKISSPVTMVAEMTEQGLFPVFFADEVEHCYEKNNAEALSQVRTVLFRLADVVAYSLLAAAQFLTLADSTRSLCIATGSVASLPDMIAAGEQTAVETLYRR